MPKRDVESDILGRLDDHVRRGGTIPGTVDGKVNVSRLCRELGLAASDAQHLHRKDSVKLAVNALAEEQGLRPVGARAAMEEADRAVAERSAGAAKQARDDGRAAVEQSAAAAALLEELREARREIAELRLNNAALRERLRLLTEGGLLWEPS